MTDTPPVTPPPAPWHTGVLDADVLGHAQNKGWLPAEVKDVPGALAKAVKAHMEAQKLIGLPPDRVLRLPEASAQPAELDAFWQRLGVPKEAKEYEFKDVKFSDGTELEDTFRDTMRTALLGARVPKEQAAPIVKAVVKYLDEAEAAEKTIRAGNIAAEKAWLDKNWPAATREANMFVANQTLQKIGAAAGLTAEETKAAWDALSTVGGIGAAKALEMLRTIGQRIGEGKFVSMSDGKGGDMPMTVQAAQDEINALKKDEAFQKRRQEGGVAENARWKALFKIATASQAA